MEENNNSLFREKSLKRISSPEMLNDYIKVASPGVWMLIVAMVLIIAGAFVWSFFFDIEQRIDSYAYVKDSSLKLYIQESDMEEVFVGTKVSVGDNLLFYVSSVPDRPVMVDDTMDEYLKHAMKLSNGDWVYVITIDDIGTRAIDEGVNEVHIITNSMKASDFLFN